MAYTDWLPASNFLLLLPVVVLWWKGHATRFWPECAWMLSASYLSAVYHACYHHPDHWCPAWGTEVAVARDVMSAHLYMLAAVTPLLECYLTRVDPHRWVTFTGANARAWYGVVMSLLTAVLVVHLGSDNTVADGLVPNILLSIIHALVILYVFKQELSGSATSFGDKVRSTRGGPFFFGMMSGLVFGIVGVVLYMQARYALDSQGDQYALMHGLWHAAEGVAVACFFAVLPAPEDMQAYEQLHQIDARSVLDENYRFRKAVAAAAAMPSAAAADAAAAEAERVRRVAAVKPKQAPPPPPRALPPAPAPVAKASSTKKSSSSLRFPSIPFL